VKLSISLSCSFICFKFGETVLRIVWVVVNVGDFDSVRESETHGCEFSWRVPVVDV
jgi:hypothetical protein